MNGKFGPDVGIIIAHPDDESMFFLPTIWTLLIGSSLKIRIHLLCLSTGDFEGLGETRKRELEKAANINHLASLKIIDDSKLRDGMKEYWDPRIVAKHVDNFVQENNVKQIITFDGYGISGHPNHIAVWQGVILYLEQQTPKGNRNGSNVTAFQLISTNVIRKYSGIFDLIFSLIDSYLSNKLLFLNFDLRRNYNSMMAHHSQFVWFRHLFVLFSRYSFVNTLEPIPISQ